jgi:hypothetical protein
VQCSAVQCSAVQCSAVQCSAVQCSAVQCSAMQCSAQPVDSLPLWSSARNPEGPGGACGAPPSGTSWAPRLSVAGLVDQFAAHERLGLYGMYTEFSTLWVIAGLMYFPICGDQPVPWKLGRGGAVAFGQPLPPLLAAVGELCDPVARPVFSRLSSAARQRQVSGVEQESKSPPPGPSV